MNQQAFKVCNHIVVLRFLVKTCCVVYFEGVCQAVCLSVWGEIREMSVQIKGENF